MIRSIVVNLAKKVLKLLGADNIKRLVLEKEEKQALKFINKGYLRDIGWWDSWQYKQPVRNKNEAIPWVTYSFIYFIQDRILPTHKIFEFGSGNSTMFYAKRARKVVAVEHDNEWYHKINSVVPDNVEMLLQELEYDGDYCRVARNLQEKFDIIIVDGRDRVNCIKQSVEALSENGIIILDDSERDAYQEGINYLKERDFRMVEFWGISPGLFYLKATSIFYRTDNSLSI